MLFKKTFNNENLLLFSYKTISGIFKLYFPKEGFRYWSCLTNFVINET